ncbi:chemotaxis protein CheW [Clostridium felsineum]|uniref:chemotaxis protein CheW n=1 Tax=Clostridium felsineum TaxID=36839 RepID=UPI00098C3586|nr:chemotaxis protein CheW [Clostridium felsineum]URZ18449.1 Chemotaxis protein CheW [Clostridium felsineum DSM 794]
MSEFEGSILNKEDTQNGKFLIFNTDGEQYGIEIKHVIEIIGISPISEIPELPKYIMGVINLRGKVIPVIDIRLRFNKSFKDYNDRTCIVIIEVEDMLIGVIVDKVLEVLRIKEEEIMEPPEISRDKKGYIKAIGKSHNEINFILDCERLISSEEIKKLSSKNDVREDN